MLNELSEIKNEYNIINVDYRHTLGTNRSLVSCHCFCMKLLKTFYIFKGHKMRKKSYLFITSFEKCLRHLYNLH